MRNKEKKGKVTIYTFSSSDQKPATVCMLHTRGLHLRQQFIKQSNITTDHLNININTAKCTYLWQRFENAVHNECHFKRGRHSTIFSFNSYTKLMYHRYQCQLPYLLNSNVCSLFAYCIISRSAMISIMGYMWSIAWTQHLFLDQSFALWHSATSINTDWIMIKKLIFN